MDMGYVLEVEWIDIADGKMLEVRERVRTCMISRFGT